MVVVNEKTYWTFSLTVRIPALGKARLVISYENGKLTDTYVVSVTNALDWEAKRILATYWLRWPIETFYQDGKEQLGLDEYLMRNAQAIGATCRQQARTLIELRIVHAHKMLQNGDSVTSVFGFLFAKQRAYATA